LPVGERLRIVVAGGVGAMPFAGVGWQVAHYLEGFRRLGHDVFYLEDTQRWPYDPVNETVCDDPGPAIAYVRRLMERHGVPWAYQDVASNAMYGCSEVALRDTLAGADVLVNVSGVTVLRDEHLRVPVRVYLESDPVLPQIEVARGRKFTIDLLAAHTHHFTYGQNFGAPDCGVPIERFDYRPTRPPVILDWWRTTSPPATRAFTTIANWRQTSNDIDWKGRTLTWSKDVQFKRFAQLASRVRVPIELALAAGDGDEGVEGFRRAGWRIRPAGPLSKDIDAYRDYIRSSAGEFSVAKEQNVALRSGWFSDRTASYLAAGRPAIVQDTGFGCALPAGEGLLAFSTLDEAMAAFDEVESDYRRHSLAAFEIAREYLRAETVLGTLIDCVSASASSRTTTSRSA
jgi:hypothetical protein